MNTTTQHYYYWSENKRYGTAVAFLEKPEAVSPKALWLKKALVKHGRPFKIIDRITHRQS